MMIGFHNYTISFTREHARLLRNQRVTETEPGSIVADFQMLLEYVLEKPLKITKGQQLSRNVLPEINQRLYHPLVHGLKNPQPKSLPPILGLYMLLRASGLTYVDPHRNTSILRVDTDLLQVWQTLSPGDRYGSLLEVWLMRSYSEIVGEERGFWASVADGFEKWRSLARGVPDEGWDLQEAGGHFSLSYTPGWHHLGLLPLFGLIKVVEGPPVPGKGWQIACIKRTPFGDALLALIQTKVVANDKSFLYGAPEEFAEPGALQAMLQPYLPWWQRTLPLPAEEGPREGLHVFKVALGRNLWRRVAIPAEASLDDLADLILEAFEFDRDHLYTFTYRTRYGTTKWASHPYMDEGPWAPEVGVGEIPLRSGETMDFIYDFGDNWRFDVTLESVAASVGTDMSSQILESKGTAPQQYPDWD